MVPVRLLTAPSSYFPPLLERRTASRYARAHKRMRGTHEDSCDRLMNALLIRSTYEGGLKSSLKIHVPPGRLWFHLTSLLFSGFDALNDQFSFNLKCQI